MITNNYVKMKKRNNCFMILIVFLLLLINMPSFAEDMEDTESEDKKDTKWEFIILPYLWIMGIEGGVTVKGRDAEVDVGFDDIVDELDLAAIAHFIAKRGRWEFFVQPNYMKLSPEGEAGPIDVDVETEMLLLEFGAFYRLGMWGERLPVSLDVLGGGRYWHIDNEIDVGVPVLGFERDVDSEKDLIDPIVGFRVGTSITKKLRFSARGDIGGFDISDDTSNLSWQAVGLFEYDISQRIIAGAGYRALDIDYEKGSGDDKNAFDVTIHGPVLGVGIRF
ncbi:MAG: hypothetical protein JETT_0040 [Candidatus Jettenia ecosi]|uniref:Outer membrane protein beta-barrel domain-containing protein n=1 Tax=Candidatus Jettenia ecosi TaxID=2494326 RepID=A0A533QG21_9BACT|nr:MAG: hypothetical protein JETT_0040 [Candidatus Jettenia ecosi]